MTKVERLLINKGHYMDETYHLVMGLVKVIHTFEDDIQSDLDDDMDDEACSICELRADLIDECKIALFEALEAEVDKLEDKS